MTKKPTPKTPKRKKITKADIELKKVDESKMKKGAFISEFNNKFGRFVMTCEALGLNPIEVKRLADEDAEFREQLEFCQEKVGEIVEGKLFELIKGVNIIYEADGKKDVVYRRPPCIKAITFFLTNHMKNRSFSKWANLLKKDEEIKMPDQPLTEDEEFQNMTEEDLIKTFENEKLFENVIPLRK